MNSRKLLFAATLFAFVGLSACDRPSTEVKSEGPATPATVVAKEEEKAEIAWFQGRVDEAFAHARTENKPVFLYWGAVWCPPCLEIKQTVLKDQQFIAQSRLFVSVYLDGDTERAQIYGEKFGAIVYPTMIVFNPEGEEVTRLHAGMDLAAYGKVLEASLDSLRPTSSLIETAQHDANALTDEELQRLAYYSWYDDQNALPDEITAQLFATLSEVSRNRNPNASARFYLQYLAMLAGDANKANARKADPATLRSILSSREQLFVSWDYLTSYPLQIVSSLDLDPAALSELQTVLAATVLDNRHDERLSTSKQMSAWNPYLAFHFHGDEENSPLLPDDIIAAIRADGKAADEKTAGIHTRQNVIDEVMSVYLDAGLTDDARELVAAEIEKSKTPYYFMSSLAYLEEREGNYPRALELRKQAYEASSGPATRIRWWSRYVQAAVRMAPENPEAVLNAAMAIFGDAEVMDDAWLGFNARNFGKATAALRKWDAEQNPDQTALTEYLSHLQGSCDSQTPESVELGKCRSLLTL